jgi:hypothetical protein
MADIYKCRDSKGNDKYQNFPCPIDSIGSKATAPPPKADAVKSAAAATPDAPPLNQAAPLPGMKMNEVRKGWGAPRHSQVVKGIEIWYYFDEAANTTRSVHFDRTGTILNVTEQAGPPPKLDDDDGGPATQ